MSEDWWQRWLRGGDWWPFSRRWMVEDVDKLFREMESMMRRQFEGLSKMAPRELIRERMLPDGSKVKEWGPFVYGYSVTMDPRGRPLIREFGNIKPETRMGRPRISVRGQREPLIDILESEDGFRVIAEVPGVEKKDINLHGTGDSLTISVDTPQRKYYKEVELPAKVDLKQAKSSYRNGVLEVFLPKKKEEKLKGEKIEVE